MPLTREDSASATKCIYTVHEWSAYGTLLCDMHNTHSYEYTQMHRNNKQSENPIKIVCA